MKTYAISLALSLGKWLLLDYLYLSIAIIVHRALPKPAFRGQLLLRIAAFLFNNLKAALLSKFNGVIESDTWRRLEG